MIKVGLIGIGGMGGNHFECYKNIENAEVVAVADVREAMASEKISGTSTKLYKSIDELLEKEDLDMVDICTPSYMHREMSIKCLGRGLNVLCEKPMSLNSDDTAEIIRAAEKSGKIFMTAHVVRFMKPYVYLKNVIESNKLGRLLRLDLKRISEMNGRSCGERHTSMKNPYVPDADAEGYPVVVAQPKPGSEDEIAFRPESIVILSGKKYSQAEILEKNGGNSPFRYFEPQPYKCPSVHQGSIVTITRGGVEHSGSGPDDKPVGDRIIVDSVHRDCAVDEWSYVGIHFRTPASPRRFLPNGSLSRRCQSEKRCNA